MADPALWLLLVSAAVVSALLTAPLRLWLLHKGQVDRPEQRRSHARPTPRGGGLAIVVTLAIAWLFWPGALTAWWQSMSVIIFMAAVGWVEDRHQLAASWRFSMQLIGAVALVGLAGGIERARIFGISVESVWLLNLLAVVAVIWLINLYNFMDGSDGMAAAQGVWVGLAMAVLFERAGLSELTMLALAAAGAWGGFLCWNRPPAGIFMGDAGSLALGAFVAAAAVAGAVTGAISIWLSFMVSSVFVVDTTVTLLARALRGQRWYTPHRQHAYQRLLDLGLSHAKVMGLYQLLNLLIVLPVIAAALHWPKLDSVLAVGLAAALVMGWWVVQPASTANNDKAEL